MFGERLRELTTFGDRLAELRRGANLTQGQLADKSGLSRQTVAQLETGRRKPRWETVLALSDALSVHTEEFNRQPAEPRTGKVGRPRRSKS